MHRALVSAVLLAAALAGPGAAPAQAETGASTAVGLPGQTLPIVAPPPQTGAADPSRDPFWPVGYRPPPKVAAVTVPDVPAEPVKDVKPPVDIRALIAAKAQIGGIMKVGGGYLALINNTPVGVGEKVVIRHNGESYTLVVRSITKDNVNLEPEEQQ
jgi:hypothetical protein